MDEQRKEVCVLGGKQQGHYGIWTFKDFPLLDTTGGAGILRVADQ